MITGTYNLIANPSWALAQFQEVRLECDTTTGPVTINLPAISTLAISTNLKLIVVDATANASVNNITINAGSTGLPPVSDTFDDSVTDQIVLDTNGSSVIFQNVAATQWIATDSVNGTNSTYNDILYADLYNKIINKQLILGGKYRLLDYKSVNFLNGVNIASNNPTPIVPSFNPREVYVGSNEILLLEAISNYELAPICYSETYSSDVITYQAYTNKIGLPLQLFTGNTLPDSSVLNDFNLQWDGTNIYFNMPIGYPVLNGQFLYIGANFDGGNISIDSSTNVVKPFEKIEGNKYDSNSGNTTNFQIEISVNGNKVNLIGLDETLFLQYDIDTLYVQTNYEIENAYGCISKREDTDSNITVPFDFRGRKYRRYEVNVQLISTIGLQYIGIGDNPTFFGNNFATTGNFIDSKIFNNDTFDILWEGEGNYGLFKTDNNLFLSQCNNLTISGNEFYNNTILSNSSFNKFLRGNSNVFISCIGNNVNSTLVNNLINYFSGNNIFGSFGANNLNLFNNNTVNYSLGSNSSSGLNSSYISNNIINQFFSNNIITNNFQFNILNPSSTTMNSFSLNTINGEFKDNNIQGEFRSNTIQGYFQDNIITRFFSNNIVGNNFIRNNIGVFTANNVGQNFADNKLNLVSQCTIGNSFQKNISNEIISFLNFSGSLVYGSYSKQIITGNNFVLYLSYFNGTTMQFVTPITT